MTKTATSTIALCVPLAFAASPLLAEERSAAWDLLAEVEITEIVTDTTYEARKTFPEGMEQGIDGFDITGFVVPFFTDGSEMTDFILVSDMGFCPFCGSPEHGTTLQVSMAAPTAALAEGARVTLRGRLEAVTDPDTMQSAIMRDAQIIGG